MSEIIEAITNHDFEKAKVLLLNGDSDALHKLIVDKAYSTEDSAYYSFYEYLTEQYPENAHFHYCLAELYVTVYNILPGGYEKAFEHAKKAVKLSDGDLTYKEFILFFYQLPRPLLSREDAIQYAADILRVDASNQPANLVLKSAS